MHKCARDIFIFCCWYCNISCLLCCGEAVTSRESEHWTRRRPEVCSTEIEAANQWVFLVLWAARHTHCIVWDRMTMQWLWMFVGSGSSDTVNDEWMNEWIHSSVNHVFMFSLHSVICVYMLSFQFASKCHVILDMARTRKHFLLRQSITVKFQRSALYGPTKVAYI